MCYVMIDKGSDLMNKVMHLDMDRFGPVICTLNPTISIREESIQARGNYEHPTFNTEVRCQFYPIKVAHANLLFCISAVAYFNICRLSAVRS